MGVGYLGFLPLREIIRSIIITVAVGFVIYLFIILTKKKGTEKSEEEAKLDHYDEFDKKFVSDDEEGNMGKRIE